MLNLNGIFEKVKWWIMRKLYPSQAWFWTPEWQAEERKVDEDLKAGRFEIYDSIDEFIEDLNAEIQNHPD